MLYFICSFFGILIINRMLFKITEEKFFITWIDSIHFHSFLNLFSLLLLLFSAMDSMSGLILVSSLLLLVSFIRPALEFWFFLKLDDHILAFYEGVALEMASGVAFRESIKNEKLVSNAIFSQQLSEIVAIISYKKPIEGNCHPKLYNFAGELIKIDNSQHKVLQRVKFLRNIARVRRKIRQKSRAASSQSVSQAGIAAVFYLGVLSAELFFCENIAVQYIFLSLILFLTGFIVLMMSRKGTKWKV